MISCGNCGTSVDGSDVICSHCGVVLTAWVRAGDSERSFTYDQPDYARPPAERPIYPTATAIDNATATNLVNTLHTVHTATTSRLVNTIHSMHKEPAYRLINTIKAYAHEREAESKRARSTASQQQRIPSSADNSNAQISNIAFAIGTVLVVALVLMWGIVAAMVFSDMRSIEFIVITIVLTLAFKPTMNSIRRVFQK